MVAADISPSLAVWLSVGCHDPGHALAYELVRRWIHRGDPVAIVFLHEDAVEAAADDTWRQRWLEITPGRIFACSAASQRRSIADSRLPAAGLALWMDKKQNAERVAYFR